MISDFAVNRFIFRRDRTLGVIHALLMWGCILAFAITFILVFGWIHFETVPGDLGTHRAYVFGFATSSFPIHSLVAFLIFHGLVWSAFLVIAGVVLVLRHLDAAIRSSLLQLNRGVLLGIGVCLL